MHSADCISGHFTLSASLAFRLFCDVTVFVFTVVRSYNQPIRFPGSILTYLLRDGQ
jgi:hypothetical protein